MRVLFLSILLFSTFSLFSQTKAELESRKNSAIRDLKIAQELLDRTKNEKKLSINRVAILNRGISSRERVIATIDRELDLINEDIESTSQELDSIRLKINSGKEEYAAIVYSVYVNHTEEEKLMYLLASENLNQFYQRIKYLKYLKDYRERKVKELEILVIELEDKRSELLKLRDEKTELLTEKETENRSLVQERRRKNGIIRNLVQDEKKIRKEIAEKERVRKEVEDRIRKIIEAEVKKNSGRNRYASLTPEQKLVGSSFLQNKGRLPWPVDRGIVTSEFGLVNHPDVKGVKIDNPGIDITSTPGVKGRAMFDGEVTYIVAIKGGNYAVMIMHGEYSTVYQNLVDLKVKVGDKVSAKQELGIVYSDKDDNTSVLHIQIWKEKTNLNPLSWLSK